MLSDAAECAYTSEVWNKSKVKELFALDTTDNDPCHAVALMVKIQLFDRPVNSIHTHCRKGAVVTAVSCGVQKKHFLHLLMLISLERTTTLPVTNWRKTPMFASQNVHLSSLFIVPVCKSLITFFGVGFFAHKFSITLVEFWNHDNA